MAGEKRKYRRIKSDFNVRVKHPEPETALTGMSFAKSANVSATGVLFYHDRPVETGSILNVKFLKPNSFDFFEGDAKVVRVEAGEDENFYEIGIQFIGLSESDEKKLNYYLSNEAE